ncbi:cell division protein CrgA [Bifidobacterium sp. ESL0775]|uniref:cell division protein CrgA n=1 Tax=Bifidobacterium sp. ESL0775 TaxID=2983230 RepID=UPI0023F9339B|nr:cell division protein CrgA [Bifidobacterium sp. ESL0775]WEV69435.1 cell division protein CrgA [Bifidobacterium sp. ESL0775]
MADEELDKGTDAASTQDEGQKAWDEPETQTDDDAAAETDTEVTETAEVAEDTEDDKDDSKSAAEKDAAEASKAEKNAKADESADESADDSDAASDEKEADDDDDDLDLPMDKIDALLSATSTDKKAMTPQLRRVAQRQAENSKRVEETIKGTKANPAWFVPLFCFLMILGLAWAVVYYLTSKYPIPGIGAWNLLIAFCIVMVGFIMTMWWR